MDGLLVDLRDNVSITVYFDFTYSGLHRCIVFFLWSPYVIGQTIIFLPCGFFFLLFLFFTRLISAAVDWMYTILPHMVWP